jgi:hypothetical protein
VQFISVGPIGEVLARTYSESQGRRLNDSDDAEFKAAGESHKPAA